MAAWYLGSVSYTAVPQFAISHTYSIGDFVRALAAPSASNEHVFRCTTAGTSGGSEAAWSMNNNVTTTQGTAVFTCVTGQSTYAWSAPAGSLGALQGSGTGGARITAGDTVYVASDHAQTKAALLTLNPSSSISANTLVISVNKGGSVPPVAADVLAGASFASTGANDITIDAGLKWVGCTFNSGGNININAITSRVQYLRNCALWLNNATAGSRIVSNLQPGKWVWQNTTVQFGATGQSINLQSTNNGLDWFGTASAVAGATLPTVLFTLGSTQGVIATIRGVDLSALGSGASLVSIGAGATTPNIRVGFYGCKIGASVTALTNAQTAGAGGVVELVNCDSGNTNYRCERHCSPEGDVTTETTITLSGGASDGTTTFSRKLVTTANVSPLTSPLEGFPMDVWNTTTGVSKTATVEIISSGTLTNADISLQVEYLGDASSCLSTLTDNYLATDLTTAANVTSSSATWNSSPATPVKQKLQVAFTPQKVGSVRGIVSLRKASTTVYVDPVMAIA